MMWGYLLWIVGLLGVALIWDRGWRKPKEIKPPVIIPRAPVMPGMKKHERFVHRGGYHNVYWTTGNKNRTRPWIRNIR